MPQIEASPWLLLSIFCILNVLLTWTKIYYF